jgi:hypothetical protein
MRGAEEPCPPPGAGPLGVEAPLAIVIAGRHGQPAAGAAVVTAPLRRFQSAVTELGGYSAKEMGRRIR